MSRSPSDATRQPAIPLLFAACAAVVTAALSLHPTGQRFVDPVLTAGACAAVAWAAGRAPWWLLAIAGGVTAALARNPAFLAVGLAAAASAIVSPRLSRDRQAWALGAAGAGVTVGLCGIDAGSTLGASAAVAAGIGLVVATAGIVRRSTRWLPVVIGAGVVLLAGAATALFGLTAAGARSQLERADDLARDGLKALSHGDVDEARIAFEGAATEFADVSSSLDRPWTQPARLVPVVAQHRASAVELARGAAEASRTVTDVLSELDIDSVRVVDGRIDITAVRALEAPLMTVSQTIDELQRLLDDADDQWLVSPLREKLHDLDADIDEYRGQADDALAAVRNAPSVLGADGRRVYFIAFTTQAEARGSVGFMGNWAELTVDNGTIEMTRFGRSTDLNDAGGPDRRITGMDEFLARYGGYGFNTGPGGTTASYVWQIITMSPDFPTVGEAIAQLYPQSGGQEIDGVFALDPAALAGLLDFTGPINADGVPYALDSGNVEQFLNVDQYLVLQDKPDRVDALEAVASLTVDKVLGGALPGPVELGKTFGPLVREHHIAGWLRDPDEQALAARLELDHALPPADGSGTVAVAISNSGGSKIDAYAEVTVESTTAAADGGPARVAVTIRNTAPTDLPPFVIGTTSGDYPLGTNISYVSVYVNGAPTTLTIDGAPAQHQIGTERGWYVASAFVTIPSGESRTFTVDFTATVAATDESPTVFGPDSRIPPTIVIDGVEQ